MRGAAVTAALIGTSALPPQPAGADDGAGVQVSGAVRLGSPPENNCEVNWAEENRYPLTGYGIGAKCTEIADFTKVRGVENFPVEETLTTDWFTDTDTWYGSEWKPTMKLNFQLHELALQYQTDGAGMNLYLPHQQIESSQELTLVATTAIAASGMVDLYVQHPDGTTEVAATARRHKARADLTLPGGTLAPGRYRLHARFVTFDGTTLYRTPSVTLYVD